MIRAVHAGDLDTLLHLWEALHAEGARVEPAHRPRPDARRHMEPVAREQWVRHRPFPHAFLAEEEGQPVGFIWGFVASVLPVVERSPTARIADLYVVPGHRRRGLGRALVGHFVRSAAEAGFPRVEVGTFTRDRRALRFWEAMGFGPWQVLLAHEALPGDV